MILSCCPVFVAHFGSRGQREKVAFYAAEKKRGTLAVF